MSHFSRIKTNIVNFEVLKKTLIDLGFKYKCIQDNNINNYQTKINQINSIYVYHNLSDSNSLFNFSWNGLEYVLVADFQLWNLDINVNYFLEKLTQCYASNIVLYQGRSHGFQASEQKVMQDGSIKIVMQRWNIL
uniref:Uncharacterized protein ycf35 n=1 Tax=Acrosorium ciliolatum TaxID=1550622 RepID=A0A1Z1M299_9FLOR|nr:hypothetical protein [Acrosorium ciliolatum]ARW59923.1 hypothetical protein [Acrosorium ciliolatum]